MSEPLWCLGGMLVYTGFWLAVIGAVLALAALVIEAAGRMT